MPVAGDGDEHLLVVTRGEKLVDAPSHRAAHVARPLPARRRVLAGDLRRGDVLADPEDDRLVEPGLDRIALAGLLAAIERRKDADEAVGCRADIGDRRAGAHGLAFVTGEV